MKKSILFAVALLTITLPSFAQIRQGQGRTVEERGREKTEQVMRTEEAYKQLATQQDAVILSPAFYPAVMNVDVQMVLAKADVKNFAEAKAAPVTPILDGDPAWLFVRFNGKLEKYVYRLRDGSGGERYLMFAEYGPQGDSTAKSHSIIEFKKSELAASELKFALSPGKAGHNQSLAIFIKNIATSRPGRWNNELRLTNNPALPRGPSDYLAKTAFVTDFTKGISKYPKMPSAFESMVLRDTTDETKLPIEGKFTDDALRAELAARLSSEGILPTRVYFSGDTWFEYSDLPTSQRQFRTVTATFRYQRDQACLYGTAVVTQAFDPMTDTYGSTKIEIKKDLPTACSAD